MKSTLTHEGEKKEADKTKKEESAENCCHASEWRGADYIQQLSIGGILLYFYSMCYVFYFYIIQLSIKLIQNNEKN